MLKYSTAADYSDLHVYERVLDLDSLSAARRGVFLVELIGGGYRARSIVRKGAIVPLTSWTAQGHVFRLLDEESAQPLRDATVFLNGHTYNADPATGLVLVPFTNAPNNQQKVVLMGALPGADAAADDHTFASLATFSHLAEHYDLSASFYVDREALLAQTRAPVLVRASLSILGQSVSAERNLRRVALRIDMVDADGTPSTQSVDPFPISDDEESVHSLSVPANLQSLSFTLSGEVCKRSNGEVQQLSAAHSVEINAQDRTNFIEDMFLKFGRAGKMRRAGSESEGKEADEEGEGESGGSYSLYVLGKSGEPVRGRQVRLQLRHQFLSQPLANHEWLELATDANGCIELGELQHVYEVSAWPVGTSSHTSPSQNRWTLTPAPQHANAPFAQAATKRTLVVQEGQPLSIPFTAGRVPADADALASGAVFVLAEDRGRGQLGKFLARDHVQLVHTDAQRVIRVSALPAGHYVLLCKAPLWHNGGQYHSWNVHVVGGSLIMNEYLLDRQSRQLVQAEKPQVQRQGPLQIVSARSDSASRELVVQLAGVSATTRVHVVSSHFHPEFSMQGRLAAQSPSEPRVQIYSVANSAYLPQKLLGDEVCYILDRQLAGERVGNMLPRPSLLLNEHFVRDTQFAADPTMSAGEQYTAADVAVANSAMARSSIGYGAAAAYDAPAPQAMLAQPMMSRMVRGPAMAKMAMGFAAAPEEDDGSATVGIVDFDGGQPSSRHQLEFLAQPSTLLANLRPDADTQTLRIPLSAFRDTHHVVSMVAVDSAGQAAAFRHALSEVAVPVRGSDAAAGTLALDPAYRDMRLMPALDPSKRFCEHHLISALAEGESLEVADAKSSQVETYDSLSDYWSLLRALVTDSGRGDILADLGRLDFLPRWSLLSDDERDAKYSEHSCHELNLFLYFKDPAYFTRVVQPFLINKLLKTPVDLFLLGGDLSPLLQPHAFESLNAFERILLAMRLQATPAHSPRAQEAQTQARAVLDLIIQTAQAGPKEDAEEQLAFFKTAVACKRMAKGGDDEDDVQEPTPRKKQMVEGGGEKARGGSGGRGKSTCGAGDRRSSGDGKRESGGFSKGNQGGASSHGCGSSKSREGRGVCVGQTDWTTSFSARCHFRFHAIRTSFVAPLAWTLGTRN